MYIILLCTFRNFRRYFFIIGFAQETLSGFYIEPESPEADFDGTLNYVR